MNLDVPRAKSVVIENVSPRLVAEGFPVKRILGERVVVEADIFPYGHDLVGAVVKYRHQRDRDWSEAAMAEIGVDRRRGVFVPDRLGLYRFTIEAWVNWFRTWLRALDRRVRAGIDVAPDLASGAEVFQRFESRARDEDREAFERWARWCRVSDLSALLGDDSASAEMDSLLSVHREPEKSTVLEIEGQVVVDPPLARFGAWYEVFPRSCASEPGRHGTLRDLARRLPKLAGMGFDVVYMPPIHPIGRTARKGKNNSLTSRPGDPGSPWAVGSAQGGHKSIHPRLGTLDDFQFLLEQARSLDMEIALDMALHCSPDHPYVAERPEWFRKGPDGRVQCAEDPPNRYEDVYPFDFDSPDWLSLWTELKSVFEFWAQQGVKVFRVDNPHTKPFDFWRWLIGGLKWRWPELIFLSEGLTRPKQMAHLAKLGFTQSYDYFPWYTSKIELTDYYRSLTWGAMGEYFRPNLWPNTPQLLPPILRGADRPAFAMRFVLAATLGASYGIYGPAYEHCENRGAGSVDYLDSEQYELWTWPWERTAPLEELITKVNRIRRREPALQSNESLRFHPIDNDQLISYSKSIEDYGNVVLTIVNLDPHHKQSGFLDLSGEPFWLEGAGEYTAHDLLTDARYRWRGARNYVDLDPARLPAHIIQLR